jgi:predicted nucleic acid-binding protein
MPRKAKAYVLDTWAVIAYLEDEPSAEQVENLLSDAYDQQIPIYMTIVNIGEVWYIIAREVSEEEAEKSVKTLRQLRVQFEDVNWALTREAARFKSQHKMSYADCYAAALAKSLQADLITGDKEFKPLETEVNLTWIA